MYIINMQIYIYVHRNQFQFLTQELFTTKFNMDEVTKHEIAAHERLEMIVKKEAKIQDKRDERERRRMRNLRKKANRAPALREKRFLKNAAKRAEEVLLLTYFNY
jgi:hypothetical protein